MTTQPFRTPDGGLIDRGRTLDFTFDGRGYRGHPGDTLASALLANGVRLVARSFKYHRPRGIFSAGAEEPNALVQLGHGPHSEPNTRATMVELRDGLTATSQNRWPGLSHDLGALNGLLSPLFPAGFYYKTFMWPAAAWPLYERLIRRVAGMGHVPREPDLDRYDKQHAHCDVLVVGGGPAGLAAALAAARCRARVILADEQPAFGGGLPVCGGEIDGGPAGDWARQAVVELEKAADTRLLPRTTAIGIYDHGYVVLCERVADHLASPAAGQPRLRLWKVRARRIVLATGALERPLVFPDNDRPGVMLAGAARAYVNRYGVRPGERAVLFTNNDSAYDAADDLAAAGVEVAAFVDLRAGAGAERGAGLRARGVRILSGEAVVGVGGRRQVREAVVKRLDGTAPTGLPQPIPADLICVAGGWMPNLHLFATAGGRLLHDAASGRLLPGEAPDWLSVAGACAGAETLGACLDQGFEAGQAAALATGNRRRGRERRRPAATAAAPATPPLACWFVTDGLDHRSFVDLQNDVTAADIALAVREGFRSIEHVKRYTTAGMGTDQGRTANLNVIVGVAAALGEGAAAVGSTTFRPPYTPVTFGAIAGRDHGPLLDPVRETPMQAWHTRAGAVFEPVGQWLRPRAYPGRGESLAAAVRREVLAVRRRAGLLDASTLGKIDIRGPDAAAFLERVYTNAWRRLPVGRSRYGLMLDEQGMVLDDGVTTRLGEQHFHMTTTSGNAAAVLAWLESWLQTEWPELRVWCTSVTEQWAVITLCGPLAREILAVLAPDLAADGQSFPHMSLREAAVAGVPARLFRVSFTGEVSYEINVPAGAGLAVWEAAMRAGEIYGLTPFGTDAMHLLRAEVGFIMVGQETDGTVTPGDLGYRPAGREGDFIGRRSLSRPDTAREDRLQLVGLSPRDPRAPVPEGAQIVPSADPRPPQHAQGHVTSSYHSPTLERRIVLAMLAQGRARHGETVFLAFDGQAVPAVVGPPRFLDPDGERARA